MARLVERDHPRVAPLDAVQLHKAFRAFGSRPQLFIEAMKEAVSPFSGEKHSGVVELRMLARGSEYERARFREMESEYLGLKPLEQAVIWRMMEQADRFAPYDAAARAFYAHACRRKEVSV